MAEVEARASMTAPARTSCSASIQALLAALCMALAAGCGTAEQREGAPATGGAPAGESSPTTEGTGILWPGLGDATIALDGNRVEVLSNEASRFSVLTRLAAAVGFELELGDAEDRPFSVHIEPTDLRLAIPILVGDLQYRADYVFDEGRGGHVLRRLEVAPASPEIGSRQGGGYVSGRERRPRPPARGAPGREEVPRIQGIGRALAAAIGEDGRERYVGDEAVEPEILEALRSRDAEARATAAEDVDPEGDGLARLLTLALDDPDPKVRAVATAQLADGDSFGATSGLLDALGDPDRRVVLAAIEALSDTGDSSVLFALEPLRMSRDREIRTAAEEAVETLEF